MVPQTTSGTPAPSQNTQFSSVRAARSGQKIRSRHVSLTELERGTFVTTTARELFAGIPPEVRSREFAGWEGSYKFDVVDQGVWNVNVHDGVAEVREGAAITDCVIRCDNDVFMRIASGEQNLLTAWMQGRVEADGDMALLQRFLGFVRSDERSHREAA